MTIETVASVVCLDLVRSDVFSSEKTMAQPTATVAIRPPARKAPRIHTGRSAVNATTSTARSTGQNIEPTARRKISISIDVGES
jgi:hypothetical protein